MIHVSYFIPYMCKKLSIRLAMLRVSWAIFEREKFGTNFDIVMFIVFVK